jgi:hypothetical protein
MSRCEFQSYGYNLKFELTLIVKIIFKKMETVLRQIVNSEIANFSVHFSSTVVDIPQGAANALLEKMS